MELYGAADRPFQLRPALTSLGVFVLVIAAAAMGWVPIAAAAFVPFPMLVAMRKARQGGIAPRLRDHENILRALQRHDPHAARNAMHSHLNRVLETLLRQTEVEAMQRARGEANALRTRFRVPQRGVDADNAA